MTRDVAYTGVGTRKGEPVAMNYSYSGHLKTVLGEADPSIREGASSIEITADDLAAWRTVDVPTASEWRGIPARRTRTDEGVCLQGRFDEVRRIETLSPEDPRYWVPLSSLGWKDGPFPIDLAQYPIVEVTYRCLSEHAHATWMWTYPGGSHFGALPYTRDWRTVARLTRHFDFPDHIDALVLRLYSPTRTTEQVEFQSVRFRAMSPAEAKIFNKASKSLNSDEPPKRYSILDEFMPIGVYIDAQVAKRLAAMLDVSVRDYWSLVMEDLALHHHNAIALSRVDTLEPDEWRDLQDQAQDHGIKFIARHTFRSDASMEDHQEVVDSHIKPFANSPSILAHGFSGEPFEDNLNDVLEIKKKIEKADPERPVSIVSRYPNAYPLFAPFFSASGVGHFATRAPWQLGDAVRAHLPLGKGQQFWVAAPAFSYTTETPEWSTGPEMRLMSNLAFANGAKGWLAYTYHNDPVWVHGRCQRSLTGPFLTFSDLWALLGQRMGYYGALAPLFLGAHPAPWPDWIATRGQAHAKAKLPKGIPAASHYHLQGKDYSLYIVLSNDTYDMTTAEISVRKDALGSREVYVLSDYVLDRRRRNWVPMPLETNLEMFPGQAHIMLVAEPEVCRHWCEEVARRLVQNECRRMSYDLRLATNHGLDCSEIQDAIDTFGAGDGPAGLLQIDRARDSLMNLLFESSIITDARSRIIEASSALCACDGALCRLMGRGKIDQAQILGEPLLPIAGDVTKLRLRLRRGEGEAILKEAGELVVRSLDVLDRVRTVLT